MRPADPPELELQTVSQHGVLGLKRWERAFAVLFSLLFRPLLIILNCISMCVRAGECRCPCRLHTPGAGVRAA